MLQKVGFTLHIGLLVGSTIAFVERCDAWWNNGKPNRKRRGSLWSIGFLMTWVLAESLTFVALALR